MYGVENRAKVHGPPFLLPSSLGPPVRPDDVGESWVLAVADRP